MSYCAVYFIYQFHTYRRVTCRCMEQLSTKPVIKGVTDQIRNVFHQKSGISIVQFIKFYYSAASILFSELLYSNADHIALLLIIIRVKLSDQPII